MCVLLGLIPRFRPFPGLTELNTVKFDDSTAKIKLSKVLPNFKIIKFDLNIGTLRCQCRT